MAQIQHPLRLNVGFIIHQPIGYNRDIQFNFPAIHLHPDMDLTDLSGVARIGRTQQGLILQGQFKANITAECRRCLSEFVQPIQTDFSELYAFTSKSVSESGLILPEDGNIDLEPLLRDYLLIEVPISPLCKDDCKGLCTVCGENLNLVTCEHQFMGDSAAITQEAE